ncbi:hypothetical protein K492DRAFT_179109 [Lichtheimia hyalospora FSU 10163]|nr:hypothetical protein K492DRAFT_179109 [Lichtheimia hyalospora FSU 10163]
MDFSTTRKRFGDIKILDHRMAVIVWCHFNACEAATSNWCRHCNMEIFLVDINHQAPMRIPWMFSRHANIFDFKTRIIFVPTLFVMHDVSLTPTRKVA